MNLRPVILEQPIPFCSLGRYGFVKTEESFERLGCKYIYELYIAFQKIRIGFPTYELSLMFIECLDQHTEGTHWSRELILYRALLDFFKETKEIPSTDYFCHTINKIGGYMDLFDERQVSTRIVEWLDYMRFHFLTVDQFTSIDFNKYFNEVDRNSSHFRKNIEYLTKLHHKPKINKRIIEGHGTIREEIQFYELSKMKQKHLMEKTEYILRNDILSFAINHFNRFVKHPQVKFVY